MMAEQDLVEDDRLHLDRVANKLMLLRGRAAARAAGEEKDSNSHGRKSD
jgi:hypothetical protein